MDKWNRHGLVIATALAFLAILGLGWPGAVGTDMKSVLLSAQGDGSVGGHYAPMFTFLWRCILSLIPLPVALPCAFLIQQTA